MATVDIVVRTKDRPRFLRRAFAGMAAQTYTDWRAVVVNDGGDPDVLRAEVDAAGIGDRVTVLDHPTSLGRWPSANAGIHACDAPYVVLHDDDDTWHPEFLARSVAHLEADPDAIGVVSRIEIVWERFDGEEFEETGREVFQPQLTAPMLGDVLLFNRFVPIGFLYRREVHELVGDYREDLAVVGDWEFNLRILTRWPLTYVADEPLAYWHQRPASTGIDGNSVIAESDHHRHYDRWVRDARLREHVQRDGDGDLLYLTKFVDQRFLDLEHFTGTRIDRLEHDLRRELQQRVDDSNSHLGDMIWEASTLNRLRGKVRRALRRG